jgi:hypothetical protein
VAQGSVIVRELIAMLGFELDEDALDEWDARVTGIARDVATTVAAMGTAVVTAAAAATQELISMGDELGDAAVRTGMSARELAEWDHVAQLSGTSAEAVRGVLSRLPGVMDRVASGNRAMRSTFSELGVSVTGADGAMRSSGDVLQDLIGGLARIENPAQRAAMATRVFGRRGAELAGLFEQGSDGVARLRGEVRALYGDDLEGFVEAAGRAQDAEDRLALTFRAFAVFVGSQVLPVVAELIEGAVAGGRSFMEWARGTTVVRAALISLTAVVSATAVAATALALSTIEIWGPVALGVGAVVAAMVLLGLAIDDILTFFEGGDSIFGQMLGDDANEVLRFVREMTELIRKDLAEITGDVDFSWVDLLRMAFEVLVSVVGTAIITLLIATRMVTFMARTVRELGEAVHTWISGAWQEAAQRVATFVAEAISGIARVRGALSGVAGMLGIDVGGVSGGAAKASPAAVTATPSSSTRSSTRTVSIGDIVVNGAADPGAVASEVHSRITAFFDDEADAARDDLVPEAA